MTLEHLINGKQLKPFMCLIKELYLQHTEWPKDEKLVQALKIAFPYYKNAQIEGLVSDVKQHFSNMSPEQTREQLAKWYNFFFYYKYGEESEQINSPDLFHFANKEYLLSILENKYLYPSLITLEEYKSLENKYTGGLSNEKDNIVKHERMLSKWNKSCEKIQSLIIKKAKPYEFEKYFKDNSFIPIVNCFTELPKAHIDLHADHYGSYGICFRKERIVIRETFFSNQTITPNYIRPIYYCDNSKSAVPWLILHRLLNQPDITRDETKQLMTDLALVKPIHPTLLSSKNIYSVILEREWRYVSFEGLFKFNRETIKSVMISKLDYQKWLAKKEDPILQKIVEHCNKRDIRIELI